MAITALPARAPQTITAEVLTQQPPVASQEPPVASIPPEPVNTTPLPTETLTETFTDPEPTAVATSQPKPTAPRAALVSPAAPQGRAETSVPTKPGAYISADSRPDFVTFVAVGTSRNTANDASEPAVDATPPNESGPSIGLIP